METLTICENREGISEADLANPANLYITNSQATLLLPCLQKSVFKSVVVNNSILLGEKKIVSQIFAILKDDGQLTVAISGSSYPAEMTSYIKISGFTDVQENPTSIVATKKTWSAKGASLKERREKQAENGNGTQAANPWAGKSTNDAEMVDEDDLLNEESKTGEPVKKFSQASDCITKPKACENCTCGRKELEETADMDEERRKALENGNVKSNCGKCYLGDAFRCATCPYLGQPAFEPGDKVKLKNSAQDKVNEEAESIATTVKGTKVVLQL